MEDIEALYELSPMQQGMLFHSLYDPQAGMYVEQLSFALHGNLDVASFERAWQRVMERHPVLRTSFYWEELDKPLQMVHRRADLPWRQHDWRELPPDEQATRLEAYLADDRTHDFELSQAPLMRLVLFRLAAEVYQVVWSYQHLLLDGWSLPLVLNEVFAHYEAFAQGRDLHLLAHPRPYEDYIEWLQQQDLARAEAFWRQALAGFTAPTPLGVARPIGLEAGTSGYAVQDVLIDPSTSAALQALARQHGLTLNTLVHRAWALLLSRYSG